MSTVETASSRVPQEKEKRREWLRLYLKTEYRQRAAAKKRQAMHTFLGRLSRMIGPQYAICLCYERVMSTDRVKDVLSSIRQSQWLTDYYRGLRQAFTEAGVLVNPKPWMSEEMGPRGVIKIFDVVRRGRKKGQFHVGKIWAVDTAAVQSAIENGDEEMAFLKELGRGKREARWYQLGIKLHAPEHAATEGLPETDLYIWNDMSAQELRGFMQDLQRAANEEGNIRAVLERAFVGFGGNGTLPPLQITTHFKVPEAQNLPARKKGRRRRFLPGGS